MHKAKSYTWTTQEGEKLKLSQMTNTHLFYAIRMIFNHAVSADLQITPFKYYTFRSEVKDCLEESFAAMLKEWAQPTRKDLEDWQLAQMSHVLAYKDQMDYTLIPIKVDEVDDFWFEQEF